jgi:HEAT repeat protein
MAPKTSAQNRDAVPLSESVVPERDPSDIQRDLEELKKPLPKIALPKPTALDNIGQNSAMPAEIDSEKVEPEEKAKEPPTETDPALKSKVDSLRICLRPESKATKDEIISRAREAAAFEKGGKLAACRELCNAQVSGDRRKEQAAADALSEINKPLQKLIGDMLKDDDINVRMTALKDLAQLGDDDAREAALPVLKHFKSQILRDAKRKYRGKFDYAANPEAGVVIDVMFAIVKNKEDLGQYLRTQLTTDSNGYVRAAAARHYPQTENPTTAVSVLKSTLNNLIKLKGTQRDEACVAIIQSLGGFGSKAKEALAALDQAKNDGSKRVREAASEAAESIKSSD